MPRFKKGSKEAKAWGQKMREAQLKKQKPEAQQSDPVDEEGELSQADLGIDPPQQAQEQTPADQPIGACSECGFELMEKAPKCPNCGEEFEE